MKIDEIINKADNLIEKQRPAWYDKETEPKPFNQDEPFYHGSPSGRFVPGQRGIHVGSKNAATQALEARIGVPAEGEWNGQREYGKTLLAGKKRLQADFPHKVTGHNVFAPDEDYFPHQHPKGLPKYSDQTQVNPIEKPHVFPVRIKGSMSNAPHMPMTDTQANAIMARQLKLNNAKRGYYYRNIGEDEGSISAVVPHESFIERLDKPTPTMQPIQKGKVYVQSKEQAPSNVAIQEGPKHGLYYESRGRQTPTPNETSNTINPISLKYALSLFKEFENDGNEHVICHDNKGKVVVHKAGTKYSIVFEPREIQQMLEKTNIHTHPDDRTFSEDDLNCSAFCNVPEAYLITKNYLYCISNKENEWPPEIYHTYKTINHELQNKYFTKITGMSTTGIDIDSSPFAVEFRHELLTKLAKKYNLSYRRYDRTELQGNGV